MKQTLQTNLKSKLILLFALCIVGQSQAQIGVFTVDGELIMGPSTTVIDLASISGPGSGHDQLVVTDDLTLDGSLIVNLDGYSPVNTDQFEIIDFGGTLNGTFSSIAWPAGMSVWQIDYGVLSPGKVTIYGPQSALPIELVYFRASSRDGEHILSWQTATEINNDYFDVESSTDGVAFEAIARQTGAGNSSSSIDYIYSYKPSSYGQHYYRLKQVDYDGVWSYSDVVAVREYTDGKINLYPNPSRGIIYFSEEVESAIVLDAVGREVMTLEALARQVDLGHLPSGQYFISVNGTGTYNKITIKK